MIMLPRTGDSSARPVLYTRSRYHCEKSSRSPSSSTNLVSSDMSRLHLLRVVRARAAPHKKPAQGVFHSEGGRSFPRYHLDSDAACGAHLLPTRPASGDVASRGNGGPPADLSPPKGASSAARGSVRRGIRAGSHPPGSLHENGSRLLVPVCARSMSLCII